MHAAVLAAIVAIAAASPSAAQKSRSAPKSSTAVAAANGGQAIRIGKTLVARPFGAELVDRLALAGSYRLRGRTVHLVRGEAGGDCPSRYVFVTEQPGVGPVASSPFGTCSGDARVRVTQGALIVAMSAAAAGGPVVRFSFDGGTIRALDDTGLVEGAVATPACIPASRVSSATQAEAVAAFERDYPEQYRKRGALKKVDIDPAEMRALVADLACLAPWPAAERRVPDAATPLFASRRHGPAAFAALDAIAQDPASDAHLRAVARSFAAEMTYRVGRQDRL